MSGCFCVRVCVALTRGRRNGRSFLKRKRAVIMVKGTAGKKKEKVAKEYTFKVAHWCKNSYASFSSAFSCIFSSCSLRSASCNATSEAKTYYFFFLFR